MSVTRALALNTGVQIVGKAVSTIIGAIVVALLLRQLKEEGFGMYSTANAFFQFFAIILDTGLNVTLVQMLGERAGDTAYENRVTSATFSLRLLSALILLTAAPFIGLLFPYPWELKIALFAIWASFFTTVLNQIIIGVQQRHLKMHIVAIAEIVGRILLLTGVLLGRALHWGLVPIVIVVSIGSTVNFLINFFAARRYASFAWRWDPEFWKIILKRSWPIGVSILFSLIYYKADTLILGFVRSQAEVGIYGAAYRVLDVLASVPFMYAGVMLPLLSNYWARRDLASFSQLLTRSLDLMVLFAAPMVALTMVLGTRGMALIGGREFALSGDVLRILIVATAIIYFGTISSHVIVALQAQRKMLPLYIAVAIAALAGYLLFIPLYGMWAAAWLTVASEFAIALASTHLSLQLSGTRWNPITALKIISSAALATLVMIPLRDLPIIIPILAAGVVYTGAVVASGAVSLQTIKEITSLRKPSPAPLSEEKVRS